MTSYPSALASRVLAVLFTIVSCLVSVPASADGRVNGSVTSALYTSGPWGLERIRFAGCRDSQGCRHVSIQTVQAGDASVAATFTVTNATELQAAIATAPSGSTIHLAEGHYGTLALSGVAPGLTLTADRDAPAVLGGLDLRGVSGLALDGIVFDYAFTAGDAIHIQPFGIRNSDNIVIRNALFDGDDAVGTGTTADGYGYGTGLNIQDSQNVAVLDSEITGFMKGIKIRNGDDIVLEGNDFHSMRSDAISLSTFRNLVIEDNHFHDRRGVPDSADHPDFIQLMSKNADVPASGLILRGNLFDIGDGDKSQSIFLNNRAVSGGAGEEMFYRDFLIENNVVINAQSNGLVVGAVDGLILRNNTLLHADPLGGGDSAPPEIKLAANSKNVVLENNITSGIRGHDGQADWQVSGNVTVQKISPTLPDHYSVHFLDPTGHLGGNPTKLMLRPDSPLAAEGKGAAMMIYTETPDRLMPFVQTLPVEGNLAAQMFDATMTAAPQGLVGAQDARFDWVFSDGVTAQGQQVMRVFTEPGIHGATLTVTLPDGESATISTKVRMPGPDLMGFDPETGRILGHKFGRDTPLAEVPVVDPADVPVPVPGGRGVMDLGLLDDPLMLPRALLDPLYMGEQMEIALSLATQPGSAASGGILRFHGALDMSMRDGVLSVSLTDTAGVTSVVSSAGARLGDGFWHDVVLRHDAPEGRMELWVDGTLIDAADGVGEMALVGRDLMLGGPFNRIALDAWVSDFVIRADADDYDFADTPVWQVLDPPAAAPLPANDALAPLPLDDASIGVVPEGDLAHFAAAMEAAGGMVEIADDSGAVLRAGPSGALLWGGAGDDRFRAGEGNDILFGGGGADQFVFDLRKGRSAGENEILDLDFAGGDSLRILREDGQLWLHSAADLTAALDSGSLIGVARHNGLELVCAETSALRVLLHGHEAGDWNQWA